MPFWPQSKDCRRLTETVVRGKVLRMARDFDYDVAFSFAGEDRPVVEPIADRLKQQNVSVFYDRDKQAQMWGENLQEYLTEIYLKQARFCVMFISRAYAEKMWTRQERRGAMG